MSPRVITRWSAGPSIRTSSARRAPPVRRLSPPRFPRNPDVASGPSPVRSTARLNRGPYPRRLDPLRVSARRAAAAVDRARLLPGRLLSDDRGLLLWQPRAGAASWGGRHAVCRALSDELTAAAVGDETGKRRSDQLLGGLRRPRLRAHSFGDRVR